MRLDLAEVLEVAVSTQTATGKTLHVYYRDTAQSVDMYVSLKSCKESTPVSLNDVMTHPVKGTLFSSGAEVQGNSYSDMLDS